MSQVGSLQAFVAADGDAEERGVTRLPVHQVHKIAQLDLRLANTDRNGTPVTSASQLQMILCASALLRLYRRKQCLSGCAVSSRHAPV